MQNSKLIQVLRTFSETEWKEFEKITASPFFNKGRNLLPVVKKLRKFYPLFDSPKLTKQYVYSQVYKGKNYNENTMKKIMSQLLDMACELIKHTAVKNYGGFSNCFYSYEANFRKLDFLTLKFLNEADKIIEEHKVDSHFFEMKIYNMLGIITRNLHFDRQQLVCNDIITNANMGIYLFFCFMSKQINNLYVNDINYNTGFEKTLPYEMFRGINLEKILTVLDKYPDRYSELVKIYIYIIAGFLDPGDSKTFEKLKQSFYANLDKYNASERHSIASELVQLCKLQSEQGSLKKGESLDLINFILKNNLHRSSEKGFFPAITFLSYFSTIVSNKDFESAQHFLKKHTQDLNPDIRANLVKLCQAILYFEVKRFDEAHEILGSIDSHFFIDKYNIRVLQLKIYYEKGYIEEALSGLDAYQHFLSQNKNVSLIFKTPNQNFVKYLRQLLRLRLGNTSIEPGMIKKEITNEKNINSVTWILEKIAELEVK